MNSQHSLGADAGLMLVISAPSGTGKSTLIRRLTGEFSAFAFSVSCTTRAPRPGEEDGREYHFLTREDFERRRSEGFFAEWAEVYGNFYGTPRQATIDLLAEGRDVIFDIDVQGARQLKESMKQGCYVFIFPPSPEDLEKRLTGRGTDSAETISRRLAAARCEIADSRWFDHWIVNKDLNLAYEQLRVIYLAEKTRPAHQASWLAGLTRQWEQS
ncbi:MAG: guanylate kinase [Desulfomicrobium sp.]|nr:guanylate kinase [Pseudomonadota bacterium]MBV1712143.1 guanylate kinase [Desulfomicrobium sp.]MBU4572781.1 guanylate kinase [Pseudomonadota bacterium]MBU4594776.1 guanylate kinase [Pseudomonadota bacterium]MBV1718585.1 guanylate kinase [Desulfomicrobium sp.]